MAPQPDCDTIDLRGATAELAAGFRPNEKRDVAPDDARRAGCASIPCRRASALACIAPDGEAFSLRRASSKSKASNRDRNNHRDVPRRHRNAIDVGAPTHPPSLRGSALTRRSDWNGRRLHGRRAIKVPASENIRTVVEFQSHRLSRLMREASSEPPRALARVKRGLDDASTRLNAARLRHYVCALCLLRVTSVVERSHCIGAPRLMPLAYGRSNAQSILHGVGEGGTIYFAAKSRAAIDFGRCGYEASNTDFAAAVATAQRPTFRQREFAGG